VGITTSGKSEAAKLLGNTGSPTAFTYLELGSGSTAFAVGQTALATAITGNGLARAAATVSESSAVYLTPLLREICLQGRF
jgi:hypothetical protein